MGLFKIGFSRRKIAEKLEINLSSVNQVVKNHRLRGTTDRKKGSDRWHSLDFSDLTFIKKEIKQNNKLTCSELANMLQEKKSTVVSQWTVSRSLRNMFLFARTLALRPILTKVQKEKRLAICLEWARWPIMVFQKIIFSDECRFEISGHDGAQKIRRAPNTRYEECNIIGTKKYGGGGVMVWGCFSYAGVGKLVFVDKTLDSIGYTRLLSENLHLSALQMGISSNYIFQQDNATCHKSAYTMQFFPQNNISLLDWPSQSPDLNPNEHVWDHMKKILCKEVIKNKANLIARINEIWTQIDKELIYKLINSMFSRVKAIIRAKGGNTYY